MNTRTVLNLLRVIALPLLASTAQAQPGMPAEQRAITVNGKAVDANELRIVQRLEARFGRLPDGDYWYDAISGVSGVWGGPATGYPGPGLPIGGRLPAHASGGGNGRLTGVFINGRELHRRDVQALMAYGPVYQGRFWWDAFGNVGVEGQPIRWFNFYDELRKQGRGGGSGYTKDGKGSSTFVGSGCVVRHNKVGSGDSERIDSYYGGCS